VRGRSSVRIKNLQRDNVCTGIWGSRLIKLIGFTLLEIMVSIAIVGILSGIAYPLYTEYIEKTKIARASMDILNISARLSSFFTENARYPESLNEVGYATFLDPWGSPYQYLNLQTTNPKDKRIRKNRSVHPINTDYDLYSMGKDGISKAALTAKASRDDIIRANDGAYIGLVSDF
jgi:general secretion pathway protein G